MPRLTLKSRRISVSAEVPSGLARELHHLRNRLRRPAPGSTASAAGRLTIARRTPELHLQKRDPIDAVRFYRDKSGSTSRNASTSGDLATQVQAMFWYHTIELPGGIVTPGLYDHRPLVHHYGLPENLQGQRVLDIATFDGFWAFEMERRGGDVVAADIPRFSACDLPPQVRNALLKAELDRDTGAGFDLVHAALESKVTKLERTVYDLDPTEVGTFDLVHVADLLLHLERPLDALRAIHRVTRGKALIADCFDPTLEGGLVNYMGAWSDVPWWLPSLDTLAQMVIDAGFSDVELRLVYALANCHEERGHWRASLLATA